MRKNRVISVTNQKGGVGKTSSALNLGAALSISGKKVLIIDNDPQGNLTAALGYTPAEQSRTLSNLLLAAIDYPEDLELHLDRTVIHTDSGVDLIPANRHLADAAARLQKFNPDLKIAGILLTMYQSRPQLCQSVKTSVDEIYGEAFHVFQRPIEYSIKVAECPAAGQSIFEYAPKNAAAESYRSLAEEVLGLG